MLEIDGPMCYKIIAEYYMQVIFWIFLYFKAIFQKQSMSVKISVIIGQKISSVTLSDDCALYCTNSTRL